MRIYAAAVYLFLYIPIGIIALFSFSAGRSASQFTGFSVEWYGKALANPFVMEALRTSLIVALVSADVRPDQPPVEYDAEADAAAPPFAEQGLPSEEDDCRGAEGWRLSHGAHRQVAPWFEPPVPPQSTGV